jgi:hypothetical protein
MSGILDQMLQAQQFTPSTAEEYLALQLARRLNDEFAIKRYLHYVERNTTEQLLSVFRKAKQQPDPARSFHSSLMSSEP